MGTLFTVLGDAASGTKQIETSPDGITWTARSSPTDSNGGFAIAFGAGVFVALCLDSTGSTFIAMSSPDGISWTSHAIPQPNGVAYNGVVYSSALGLFVGIDAGNGTSALVITSPDGTTWTHSATISQDTANFFQGITASSSLLVAVTDDGPTHDVVATSSDAATWTMRLGSGTGKDWNAVVFAAGQFVAVTGTTLDHQVMTSPDGSTWTLQVTPTRQTWLAITYGNGLYVAAGVSPSAPSRPQIMTSPDGITWTLRTLPTVTLALHGIAYGNGLFVAVGYGSAGQNVLTSPDGITWTLRSSGIPDTLQAVAFGGANPTKLEISLMGTKRYGKARQPVCSEVQQPKPVKLFETE